MFKLNSERWGSQAHHQPTKPIKNGYVKQPIDWQYSTIHRFVLDGVLPSDWEITDINGTGGVCYVGGMAAGIQSYL
jgi:hypothetical protein